MVSLLAESFGNKIKTKGVLADNSKVKQLLQILFDEKINKLNKLHSLKCNLNFSEIGSDLLTKLKNSKGALYSLNKRGYAETTIDNYNFENLNNILKYQYIDYIQKDSEVFINQFTMNGKNKVQDYEFFCQDNYILFVPTKSNSSVEYYYKINDYNILDFKIDDNYFVYMILEKFNKQYLAISHLGKGFSKYNSDDSKLNLKECFNFIDLSSLPQNVISLEHIKNNQFYFICEDNQVIEVSFCKKYYFIDDEYIFLTIKAIVMIFLNNF